MKNNTSQNILSQELWIISILKVGTVFYCCIFCLLFFTFGKENQGIHWTIYQFWNNLSGFTGCWRGCSIYCWSLVANMFNKGSRALPSPCHHMGRRTELIRIFWFPPWMSYNPICVSLLYFSWVRSLVVKFSLPYTICLYILLLLSSKYIKGFNHLLF